LINEYYDQYGDRMPEALRVELNELQQRLEEAKQAVA
jgi:GTP-dependent phosphoenolpyruvate carboxykinase